MPDAELAETLRRYYRDDMRKRVDLRSVDHAPQTAESDSLPEYWAEITGCVDQEFDLDVPDWPRNTIYGVGKALNAAQDKALSVVGGYLPKPAAGGDVPEMTSRSLGLPRIGDSLLEIAGNSDEPWLVERMVRQLGGGALEGAVTGLVSGPGKILNMAQRNLLGVFSHFLPKPAAGGEVPKITSKSLGLSEMGGDWLGVAKYANECANNAIKIPADRRTGFDNTISDVGQVAGEALSDYLTGGASAFMRGADSMDNRVKNDSASQGAKDLAVLGGGIVSAAIGRLRLEKALQLTPVQRALSKPMAASIVRTGEAAASKGIQTVSEEVLLDAIRKATTNADTPIDWRKALEKGGVNAAAGALSRGVAEAMHLPGGSAAVSGEDAARAIDAIAPDASILRRRDGGAVVRAESEAISRAGQSRQAAMQADADAIGLGTVLAGIEIMRMPTGNIIVTGENAAEIVKSIAPDVPVLSRRDGAVMVSKRYSEPVLQAIGMAKRLFGARSGDPGGLAGYPLR